jgi:hypothetical protein
MVPHLNILLFIQHSSFPVFSVFPIQCFEATFKKTRLTWPADCPLHLSGKGFDVEAPCLWQFSRNVDSCLRPHRNDHWENF